jgi:nitronate monooxygenase
LRLEELIDVELPIIQAPMAGVQGHALAAAVCSAGGLGSLPCGILTPSGMRDELGKLRALTKRPIQVNFFCHAPPAPRAGREDEWRRALQPYYDELGVPGAGTPASATRVPFDDAAADVVEEFKPEVVSFHFGLPSALLLSRVRAVGAKVLCSATTVVEARWLEAHGVDAIIAQGLDAGGHRGMFLSEDLSTQLGTLALVPQVVRAVQVPVIAAGGIADARGVEAVLALGACAAQIGTAYLLCPEATTSDLHRAALQSPLAAHTAVTNVFSGRPARGMVTRVVAELGPISEIAPPFPLAAAAIAPLRAAAEARGQSDFTAMWAGQNTSGCRAIPARQLTLELAGRG